jgi:microsomal epoxide hydrolase
MGSRTFLAAALLLISATLSASTSDGYFKTSDGVRLHYLEAGRGRAIVFVPGWTMPADIWQLQIDHFSPSFHVIALDPRSQGESDKPAEGHYPARRAQDIKELADALKLQKPVLVGWSMAVGEILSYVEQFGTDNLAGVVLVDGFVKLDPQMAAGFPQFVLKYQVDRRKATQEFVKSMYAKQHSEDYLAKVTEASLKTPTNSAMALMMGSLGRLDWSDVLPKLANILVRFEYEPQLQSQADLLKTKLPNAKVDRYGDDGHALFVDDAKRFNRVLSELMTATDSASGK